MQYNTILIGSNGLKIFSCAFRTIIAIVSLSAKYFFFLIISNKFISDFVLRELCSLKKKKKKFNFSVVVQFRAIC